jgi:hypothetical protein
MRKCAALSNNRLRGGAASEFAREKPCPSCGLLPSDPDEARAMVGERAHKVIGYAGKKHPSFIVDLSEPL